MPKCSLCCNTVGMKHVYFVNVTNYAFWIYNFSGFTAWSALALEKKPSTGVGCWVKCTAEKLEQKMVGLYSASQTSKPCFWDVAVSF